MTQHGTFSPARITAIQECVADFYGLAVRQMTSGERSRHVARPRMMAMYLSRELSVYSLPAIARAFGKDHTTVMHAVRTIAAMLVKYPKLESEKAELIKLINNAQGAEAVNSGLLYLSVSPVKGARSNAAR